MGFFAMMTSNKVRVQVNSAIQNNIDSTPFFHRGDKINGQVVIDCHKMQKFRLITVQFLGTVTHWNADCKVEVVDKVVDQITYLKTAPGVEDVYTRDHAMRRNMTESVALLQEGSYTFPYAFDVPKNAVPSCRKPTFIHAQYKVIATLYGEGSSTIKSEQIVTVGSSISEEQYAMEVSSPQRFVSTSNIVRNSLLLKGSGKNGTAEVACNLSSNILVVSKAADGIQLSVEVDNSQGQQPIEWAKAELQMVTQSDWKRNRSLTAYCRQNTLNPGDYLMQNLNNGKNAPHPQTTGAGGIASTQAQLTQVTEPYCWGKSTVVAQGTHTTGYTSADETARTEVFQGALNRTYTRWSTKLAGNTVAPGANAGQFTGSVLLDVTKQCLPTTRAEFCQVNWRIAVTLSHVDKVFYLPVVVVDSVQPQQQAVQSGAAAGPNTPVPWFHHEKYINSLHAHQQYETPALCNIVTATAATAAAPQHTTSVGGAQHHHADPFTGTVMGTEYHTDNDPYTSESDEEQEVAAIAQQPYGSAVYQ